MESIVHFALAVSKKPTAAPALGKRPEHNAMAIANVAK
jgi:hypothetical protein